MYPAITTLDRERCLSAIIDIQNHLLSAALPDYDFITARLGEASGASRVYFFENHIAPDGELLMSQRAEWCAEGIAPEIDNPVLQSLPYSALPYTGALLGGDAILNRVVAGLPREERELLEPQGILSLLLLPLRAGGKFFGFFGFDNCNEARIWTETEVELLRSATLAVSLALERRQTKMKLAESERQYRSIVDNVKNVVFQTDVHGSCTFLNRAWTEITGFPVEESIGTSLLDYLHPDERLCDPFRPLLEGQQEYCRNTLRFLTRNNGFHWIEIYASLTLDESGRATGISGLLTDVTEQFHSEKILKESEERFRSLASNIPGAVYRCWNDSEWTLQYASEYIYEVTGRTAEEFVSGRCSYASIVHPDDLGSIVDTISDAIRQRSSFELEYRIYTASMEIRWVYEKGRGVFDKDGELCWLDGVICDITEKKIAEQEKERLISQLEKALLEVRELDELRGEILSIVAHDLNNPLSSILTTCEIVTNHFSKISPDEFLGHIRRIHSAARQIGNMSSSLLKSERIRNGKLQFEIDCVSIPMVVRMVEDNHAFWAKSKNITIVTDTSGDGWAKADGRLIYEAIENIMSNAIKFSPYDSTIRVCIRHSGDYIRLRVEDQGPGISPEDQKKLFQRFARLAAVPTGGEVSTGLGLSITKNIVELMNGRIRYENHEGGGAIFTLEFPAMNILVSEADSCMTCDKCE